MKTDRARDKWNRRYAEDDRIHSTAVPNQFFVAEAADLSPGRALDLACGAGRNAVWLAERGWQVTAVDFSGVALSMARALAASRGVGVEWMEADVVEWSPPPGVYDLVAVLYLQLPADERRIVLRHAAAAVRPGGTLLVVGHDLLNLTEGWEDPPRPTCCSPRTTSPPSFPAFTSRRPAGSAARSRKTARSTTPSTRWSARGIALLTPVLA